jgi:hypothetical protein
MTFVSKKCCFSGEKRKKKRDLILNRREKRFIFIEKKIVSSDYKLGSVKLLSLLALFSIFWLVFSLVRF